MTIQDQRLVALAPPLQGQIDSVSPYAISGWAYDPAHPAQPVELVVTDRGSELGIVTADRLREDLRREGYGDGHYGFELWLPRRLSPSERHVIRVFRRSDGQDLFLSPIILESGDAFGATVHARIDELLRAPMTEADLARHAAFFADVVEGLRQRIADEQSAAEPRARDRRHGRTHDHRRALVIDTALPDTTRDAGSMAIRSHLHALQRIGFEVTFVPSDLAGRGSAAASALADDGIHVRLAPDIASVEELLRRQRETFDVVYLHRFENAVRYAPLVCAYQATATLIYSVADLHHVRLAREAALEDDDVLRQAANATRLREFHAAWQASAILTHSTEEADMLRAALPDARIAVVPWAVKRDPIVRAFADRGHLAFVAGFNHAPNVDAARRLVSLIMPRVWQTHPHIKAFLIGSDMPDEVRDLAGRGIEIVGQVPDLFLVLNRVRLTVAPLAFGAGVKGKVLESFARGLPCVMSTIAAEGLDLPPAFDRVVAADDDAFARMIIDMHENASENAALAEAGLQFIEERWTDDRVDAALLSICSDQLAVAADSIPAETQPPR